VISVTTFATKSVRFLHAGLVVSYSVPMPNLLAKIEASAAARLPLPEGRKPTDELQRYKTFLKMETHRLKILRCAGRGGPCPRPPAPRPKESSWPLDQTIAGAWPTHCRGRSVD
jgi:hypothetical protein